MRYTNYPKQRYGYGERQMTKREYDEMNKNDHSEPVIVFLCGFVMGALSVAIVAGLIMRGVL